jgi:hypothetical protein
MNEKKDDGTLAFLEIKPDENKRWFDCGEIKQSDIVNLTFWVIDYIDNVKTKFGDDRFLVKIKFKMEDPEEKKFFTNSKEIKYILQNVRELNAFPRKATMKKSKSSYFIE